MKKLWGIILLIMVIFCAFGCDKNVPNSEEENEIIEIMNISLENIDKITLYSKGTEQNIAKDSEELLDIAEQIELYEERLGLIDGGAMLSMSELGDGNYAQLSTTIECDIYIIDLPEGTQIEYADYNSNEHSAVALFVIPQKGEFGVVLRDKETNDFAYATFAYTEKNIFEEIIE